MINFMYVRDKQEQGIRLYSRWLGIYFLCLILGAINIPAIGSVLRIIAFVPIIICLLSKPSLDFKRKYVGVMGYLLWCSLTIVWSINIGTSVGRSTTQITFIVFLFSSLSYSYNEQEINYLKKCLIWSSRITAIVVLSSATYAYGRMFLTGLVNEDANYLTAYFFFGIVYSLLNLINCQDFKFRVIS